MGFGALIAVDGKLLSDRLLGLIIEVRVEQHLDEPTAFALRLTDDLCDGVSLVLKEKVFCPGTMVSIAVEIEGKKGLRCLVHGPAEKLHSQFNIGGAGSWVEVHGRDRRAELDKNSRKAKYDRSAADAIISLLDGAHFDFVVDSTPQRYGDKKETLQQSGSDEKFVLEQARKHSLAVWFELACELREPGRLEMTKETIHVEATPERKAGTPVDQIQLKADKDAPKLKLDPRDCSTVTRFTLDVDTDRIAKARAKAKNDKSGKIEEVDGEDQQSPIEKKGKSLGAVAKKTVEGTLVSPGDATEAKTRLDAAISEEGWYVAASASTTTHMLHDVVSPRDILDVSGIGPPHDGAYQVKSVTHVINASDHFMDLELRRNVLPAGVCA